MKKSWAERLNSAVPHVVKPAPMDIAGMKKGDIMLVPSTRIVDAFVRAIPRGTSMDLRALRQRLARRYKAQVTCPITMGFHLRTVAEAAYEAYTNGAPWTRSRHFGACSTNMPRRPDVSPAALHLSRISVRGSGFESSAIAAGQMFSFCSCI